MQRTEFIQAGFLVLLTIYLKQGHFKLDYMTPWNSLPSKFLEGHTVNIV